MPRAYGYFLPGYVWHIAALVHPWTSRHQAHPCAKRTAVTSKEFLLKFARARRRWRHWLFEAKKRFGPCVLNYIVTSNHIHLLVRDRGEGGIARSMQLIAGRTAQEYNQRKGRRAAYWEDRYHATAVEELGFRVDLQLKPWLTWVRPPARSHSR